MTSTEARDIWLGDTPPAPEDHLAFAQERQRQRLIQRVRSELSQLSLQQLNEIVERIDADNGVNP
jgi:hypothetical protein